MPRLFVWVTLLAALTGLTGCGDSVSRTTPEGTILAAKKAVVDGRADKLASYTYADSEEMKKLLRRTGVLLRNVQKLAVAVQAKFPKEVGELKAKAEEAAKAGKATGLFSQLAGQMRAQGRRGPPAVNRQQQDAMDLAIKQIFADPYGWLEQADTRLTTAYVNDKTSAILWDGKPVMPPIGMTMRRGDDGLWYFVLPTNIPRLGEYVPKTQNDFKVFGSIVVTLDRLVVDLRKDVDGGRVASLDDLSRRAGERAFIPMVAALGAYAKLQEIQRKEQRQQQASQAPAKPGK